MKTLLRGGWLWLYPLYTCLAVACVWLGEESPPHGGHSDSSCWFLLLLWALVAQEGSSGPEQKRLTGLAASEVELCLLGLPGFPPGERRASRPHGDTQQLSEASNLFLWQGSPDWCCPDAPVSCDGTGEFSVHGEGRHFPQHVLICLAGGRGRLYPPGEE